MILLDDSTIDQYFLPDGLARHFFATSLLLAVGFVLALVVAALLLGRRAASVPGSLTVAAGAVIGLIGAGFSMTEWGAAWIGDDLGPLAWLSRHQAVSRLVDWSAPVAVLLIVIGFALARTGSLPKAAAAAG
ncbi:hypothetical protein [Nocardioides acrostichi]|uniref:Uncharacterized protein n=1 Tax=Nocardioides acrostichi TaxID=2784339 RepID=A0A930UY16_9ACTN|nr:hypothetical protein [Nocardioides acrostichi]MBF4161155.1 hypothetical protein [Nocardioides acrostichi]